MDAAPGPLMNSPAAPGYRVIDIDYAHGSGADRFVYDMSTFGPQLRFGFRF